MENHTLDEKIISIRDKLDVNLPVKGHEARFAQKLRNRKRQKTSIIWWKYAAAFAMLISLAGTIWLVRQQKPEPVSSIETELDELEVYYTTRFHEEFSRLDTYNLEEYAFARQLKEDLDQIEISNENFRKMIREQGKNEYLIDAMIENYQMKLKILRKLKKLIEKTEKTHETHQSPS
ncbi:MAG: hypothetical protein R3D00_08015 [Bacteroidia bacterium]